MNKLFLSAILLVSCAGLQAGKWGKDDYIPQLDDKAAQWAQQYGYSDDYTMRDVYLSENRSGGNNYERKRAKAATVAMNKKRDAKSKKQGAALLSPHKR